MYQKLNIASNPNSYDIKFMVFLYIYFWSHSSLLNVNLLTFCLNSSQSISFKKIKPTQVKSQN